MGSSVSCTLAVPQEEGGIDPTLTEVMVQGVFCKSYVWGGCLSLELILSGCLGSSSYASCMEANWPPGSLLMGSRVSEAFHVALIPEGRRLACSVTVGVCAHMCVSE